MTMATAPLYTFQNHTHFFLSPLPAAGNYFLLLSVVSNLDFVLQVYRWPYVSELYDHRPLCFSSLWPPSTSATVLSRSPFDANEYCSSIAYSAHKQMLMSMMATWGGGGEGGDKVTGWWFMDATDRPNTLTHLLFGLKEQQQWLLLANEIVPFLCFK